MFIQSTNLTLQFSFLQSWARWTLTICPLWLRTSSSNCGNMLFNKMVAFGNLSCANRIICSQFCISRCRTLQSRSFVPTCRTMTCGWFKTSPPCSTLLKSLMIWWTRHPGFVTICGQNQSLWRFWGRYLVKESPITLTLNHGRSLWLVGLWRGRGYKLFF